MRSRQRLDPAAEHLNEIRGEADQRSICAATASTTCSMLPMRWFVEGIAVPLKDAATDDLFRAVAGLALLVRSISRRDLQGQPQCKRHRHSPCAIPNASTENPVCS